MQYFSDSKCTSSKLLGEQAFALSCAVSVLNYYSYDDAVEEIPHSAEVQCRSIATYDDLPVPETGGTFMVQT